MSAPGFMCSRALPSAPVGARDLRLPKPKVMVCTDQFPLSLSPFMGDDLRPRRPKVALLPYGHLERDWMSNIADDIRALMFKSGPARA